MHNIEQFRYNLYQKIPLVTDYWELYFEEMVKTILNSYTYSHQADLIFFYFYLYLIFFNLHY